MIKVALIGGGPAGVSLCIELRNKLAGMTKNIEILVFEKNSHIGYGLPYAEKEPSFILNLPKETMEPISGESNQFVRWLEDNQIHSQTSFSQRHLFGQYLEYRAINAQLEAEAQGLTIKYLVDNEVLDIKKTTNDMFCVCGSKGDYDVHYVILCLGHMPPTSYSEFLGQSGYIHNPLESDLEASIDKDDNVIILGSRLTAIDVALKLKRKNHQGSFTMVSRSGLLPTVLGKELPAYSLKHLTIAAVKDIYKEKSLMLQDLFGLFSSEIQELGVIGHLNKFPKSIEDISPLEWIRNEINEAESGARIWQQVLFALYPLTPKIWSMLNLQEQSLFLKKYYSLFITYLAAFPLDNAYKIRNLLESGQLKVDGGLREVKVENQEFVAYMNHGRSHRAKWLINSTGCSYDPASLPLLKNMLKEGMVIQHPLGGIQVDTETMKILSNGGKNTRLYAVGEITKGNCFMTTDLGCVTAQTKKIAELLSSEIHSQMHLMRQS